MPVSKTIEVQIIDDPEVAMRTEIPDEYIAELANDIATTGLINPLAVTKEGQRYRLHAGHCRLLAMRKLGRATVDVRDFTGEPVALERLKFSENRHRLDVSDADMAVYLSELQERYHYTSEKLQEITGESEDWISKRLSLFAGDRDVFEALRKQEIKLGHALLLNRFPERFRAQYLLAVINSTPPVRLVEQWLRDAKLQDTLQGQPTQEPPPPQSDAPPPGVVIGACEICSGNNLNWTMEFHRVHKHCWDHIVTAIHAAEQGG